MIRINTYDLKYDAESRLVEVKKNSTVIATFAYDGDGKQVKSTINGVTTYYVGAYYQKEGTLVTKYYYAGGERVAMRQGGVLYYIFGDHLGSTAVVKNTQGGKTELRYTAWGTTRYEYGTTPTDRRYTGQREEASFGLYFYNARWYDPALGRFIQADAIVPGAGNPQAWDRYAYTSNNPVKYSDPSGHMFDAGGNEGGGGCNSADIRCIFIKISSKSTDIPTPLRTPTSYMLTPTNSPTLYPSLSNPSRTPSVTPSATRTSTYKPTNTPTPTAYYAYIFSSSTQAVGDLDLDLGELLIGNGYRLSDIPKGAAEEYDLLNFEPSPFDATNLDLISWLDGTPYQNISGNIRLILYFIMTGRHLFDFPESFPPIYPPNRLN